MISILWLLFQKNMKILEVKNIHKTLAGKQVLQDVSFEVKKWEIYGFLGPNWAGKTTTMKSIMWLIEPESGEIKVFGTNGLMLEDRKSIGFMPENTYLYKHLSGEEFLRFNAKFYEYSSEVCEKKIDEVLEKVWLSWARKKFLKEYSKWMLQRIGLAQAIINDPKILFLDEPMSGLDPIGRRKIRELLVTLNKEGTTIFFNTHILADVESICDTISIIHEWRMLVKNKKVKSIKWWLEDFFIDTISAVSGDLR